MDDTVDTSRQGREDALMALVEAGMLEGIAALNAEDVGAHPNALIVYRVPRDVAEEGTHGGQCVAEAMLLLGTLGAQGRMMLSFDGWADDERELWEVPEVVAFCGGMLLGPDVGKAQTGHARSLLDVLVDEAEIAEAIGDREVAFYTPGQHWLVACAWSGCVYQRDKRRGWSRDLFVNVGITGALRSGVVPPLLGSIAA